MPHFFGEGQDSFIELFERICKSQTCFLTSVHWLMQPCCANLRPPQRFWFWEGMNSVNNWFAQWFALWLFFRAEMIHDDKYWINDKNRLIQWYTWRQAQILLFLIFGYISSVPHPRSQGYEPPLRTTYPPVVEFLRRHAFSAFIFAVFLGTAVLLGLLVNPLWLGIDWVLFFIFFLVVPFGSLALTNGESPCFNG